MSDKTTDERRCPNCGTVGAIHIRTQRICPDEICPVVHYDYNSAVAEAPDE